MAVAPEADVRISVQADEIHVADYVALSGQGVISDCMAVLDQSDLRDAVPEAPRSKLMPSVCVGEQTLLERSTEAHPG